MAKTPQVISLAAQQCLARESVISALAFVHCSRLRLASSEILVIAGYVDPAKTGTRKGQGEKVYREHAVRDRLGFAQGVAARRCDGKPSRTHALRVVAAVAGARFRAQFPGT